MILVLLQGEVISFAPNRGGTLEEFGAAASDWFHVTIIDIYDERIHALHQHVRPRGMF